MLFSLGSCDCSCSESSDLLSLFDCDSDLSERSLLTLWEDCCVANSLLFCHLEILCVVSAALVNFITWIRNCSIYFFFLCFAINRKTYDYNNCNHYYNNSCTYNNEYRVDFSLDDLYLLFYLLYIKSSVCFNTLLLNIEINLSYICSLNQHHL